MPRYLATFHGRTRGAIGISYWIQTIQSGADHDAARLALYDRFENLTCLQFTAIPDGSNGDTHRVQRCEWFPEPTPKGGNA